MSAAELYRCWLFEDGKIHDSLDGYDPTTPAKKKAGISKETEDAEKRRRGKLSRAELLRCRVRYFSDGLVLGSKAYVKGMFQKYRGIFGPKRKSGARGMREAAGGRLCTARQLAVRWVE